MEDRKYGIIWKCEDIENMEYQEKSETPWKSGKCEDPENHWKIVKNSKKYDNLEKYENIRSSMNHSPHEGCYSKQTRAAPQALGAILMLNHVKSCSTN